MPHKTPPPPWLVRYYHTFNESQPLDRCLVRAGYRSMKDFCEKHGVSSSQMSRWRNGKSNTSMDLSLEDEMVLKTGLATSLQKLMSATGCLEWELFPEVFTADFYDGVYRGMAREVGYPTQFLPDIEGREIRRVVRNVLRTLPVRHRKIVELAFGLAKDNYGGEPTYEDIGRRFGLSREGVRQIICKGIRELRSPSRMKALIEVCWWKHDDKVKDGTIRKDWRTRYG